MRSKILLLIAAVISPALVTSAAIGQASDDVILRTDLSADDIVEIMAAFDREENNPLILKSWLPRLAELKEEVVVSTEMTAAEKRRRLRLIERRIAGFERYLRSVDVEPQEPPAHQVVGSGSPGDQGASPEYTEIPTGWRRSRSWQGGGLLPGGAWQGSEQQEAWGYSTLQSRQETSMNRDRSQDPRQEGPLVELVPNTGWLPEMGQWPWSLQQQSRPQGHSIGGVMAGGGASSQSFRSSSSRRMSRSNGQ